MSSMLEQVIVDATALKEVALKNAESILLEKYAKNLKEAVEQILEADDLSSLDDPMLGGSEVQPAGPEDPLASNIPMAATDGEHACSCPEEDEEIEIDFDQLTQSMGNPAGDELPGQMGTTPNDNLTLTEAGDEIMIPAELGHELHMYHMGMGDPVYKVGSMAYAGKPVPRKLLDDAISNLESISTKVQDPKEKEELDNLINSLQSSGNAGGMESDGEDGDTSALNNVEPLEEYSDELSSLSETELLEYFGALNEEIESVVENVPSGQVGGYPSTELEEQEEIAKLKKDSKTKEKELKTEIKTLQEKYFGYLKKYRLLNEENTRIKGIALQASKKLEEMNIENAKLMYMNRILKSDSLNERQKENFVETVSKVGSVNEAKVVFETLQQSAQSGNLEVKLPQTLSEALKHNGGNLLTLNRKQPKTFEEDNSKSRMLKLAGIVK